MAPATQQTIKTATGNKGRGKTAAVAGKKAVTVFQSVYGSLVKGTKRAQRVLDHAKAWAPASQGPAKARVTELVERAQEAVDAMAAVDETFQALQALGWTPPAAVKVSGRGELAPGVRVAFKDGSAVKAKWLKLVDDPAELDRLVVAKVVDKTILVDVQDDAGNKRLGDFSRGQLVVVREGA